MTIPSMTEIGWARIGRLSFGDVGTRKRGPSVWNPRSLDAFCKFSAHVGRPPERRGELKSHSCVYPCIQQGLLLLDKLRILSMSVLVYQRYGPR